MNNDSMRELAELIVPKPWKHKWVDGQRCPYCELCGHIFDSSDLIGPISACLKVAVPWLNMEVAAFAAMKAILAAGLLDEWKEVILRMLWPGKSVWEATSEQWVRAAITVFKEQENAS